MQALRRQIKTISDLPLDVDDRIDLVLILLGEKLASELYLRVDGNFSEEYLQGLLARIRVSGLVCSAGEKEFFVAAWNENGAVLDAYERVLVFVAKTERSLTALQKILCTAPIGRTTHEELGRLYSYPETAVKAFVGKDGFTRMEVDDYPKEITSCEFRFLLLFIFSQENWQDELEQMRKRFNRLVDVAPCLVKEQIEKQKNERVIVGRKMRDV